MVTEASFDEESQSTVSKKLAFKTSSGGYLTADKLGILSAKAMAMGPQQTFTATKLETGLWSLQTVWEKYLTVEKDEGSLSGFTVRADSDDIGFSQSFV